MLENNTLEKALLKSLSLRKSRGKLREVFCQTFGVTKQTFFRRLRAVPLSQEEKEFFIKYFKEKVLNGEVLIQQALKTIESEQMADSQMQDKVKLKMPVIGE